MTRSTFRHSARFARLHLAGREIRAEFPAAPAPPLPPSAAVIRRQGFPAQHIESTYWRIGGDRYRFWWSDAGAFDLDARRGRVRCHLAARPAVSAVEEILRGPVASFFLLHQGFEPLHAGAVAFGGRSAAFLGAPGAGKSSLVAYLSKRGARFISDDILPVRLRGRSARAYAGLPHIRLTPKSLRALGWQSRVEWRSKWKATVRGGRQSGGPFGIARIYVLDRQPPLRRRSAAGISILPLAPAESFAALVAHCRNDSLAEPWRMRAQLRILGTLAGTVPVRRLTYASGFARLRAVREEILQDLRS